MPIWFHKSVVVALTLACVLAVFVAPTIDLPDSALRAKQIACNLMACIALARLLAPLLLVLVLFPEPETLVPQSGAKSAPVLCTFLC
jgi:hypothetical protein